MCVPYHGWLHGIPRVRGGFFELEIQRHWGILMIGISESEGGVRSGISTGDRQE